MQWWKHRPQPIKYLTMWSLSERGYMVKFIKTQLRSTYGKISMTQQWHLIFWVKLYLILFQVSLLPILVTSDSELDVGESVIHSLPPVHFLEPTPPYAPHASHPGPYTPTPYPPYGYPAPPHQHALLPESPVFRNPFESHDLGDALRTADGDHLVSADLSRRASLSVSFPEVRNWKGTESGLDLSLFGNAST